MLRYLAIPPEIQKKAKDTNTDEKEPGRQRDSSVMWDRGLGFPQHPAKKIMWNRWFTIYRSLLSLLSEAIVI